TATSSKTETTALLFPGTFGSEEHHPGLKIPAEALEAVWDMGRHEERVARGKPHQLLPAPERAIAGNDKVEFVPIVRSLAVDFFGNVKLNQNIVALEQGDKGVLGVEELIRFETHIEADLVVAVHDFFACAFAASAKRWNK